MRRLHLTVIDKRSECLHHLDWRGDPIALADAHRDCVPLVPGFFMHPLLPFAAWQDTAIFFVKVNSGSLAVTKFAQPAMNAVNAHFIGHLIEESIGGLFNRLGHVQHPMAAF
ncbi:hypothetical protein D3C73_1145950 [compost metagenome]